MGCSLKLERANGRYCIIVSGEDWILRDLLYEMKPGKTFALTSSCFVSDDRGSRIDHIVLSLPFPDKETEK